MSLVSIPSADIAAPPSTCPPAARGLAAPPGVGGCRVPVLAFPVIDFLVLPSPRVPAPKWAARWGRRPSRTPRAGDASLDTGRDPIDIPPYSWLVPGMKPGT